MYLVTSLPFKSDPSSQIMKNLIFSLAYKPFIFTLLLQLRPPTLSPITFPFTAFVAAHQTASSSRLCCASSDLAFTHVLSSVQGLLLYLLPI